MIITPGIDLTALPGPFTKEQLNLLGKPTVQLETGDVAPESIDITALIASLGTGIAGVNYLHNGNFAEPLWSRGSTPVSCPAGLRTYRADNWFCLPSGAAVTYEREQAGPDFRSLDSAKLTGATGATTVDFAQDVPAHIASALGTNITASFYLLNNTGADLTPLVRIDTADAENNFNATTNRFSQAVTDAATTGNWKRWTLTIDASTFPGITYGLRFIIRLPSGALSSVAKSVNFSQIKLEVAETATAFIVDPDEQATTDAVSALVRNFLENGNFAEARWGGLSKTCTENTDNFLADGWFARPVGADGALYEKDVAAPDSHSLLCAKLSGAASTTTVDFGQLLPRDIAAEVRAASIFSIWIRNGTGAEFTPSIRIDTCDSANNFAATTNRVAVDLDPCPDGGWTRVSYPLIGGDLTNWDNGSRIVIRIPDGSMNNSGKVIKFAQGRMELGTSVTTYAPADTSRTSQVAVIGETRNLKIKSIVSSPSQLTITADEIVLKASSGASRLAKAVSVTVDITGSGANGLDTGTEDVSKWYYIYAISDGGQNSRGLLSLSSTAPALPSGYFYSALLGAVRNDSSSNFLQFHQLGRKVWQVPVNVANNVTLTTSYATLDLSTAVPPNAILAGGSVGGHTSALRIALAASTTGIGELIAVISDGGGSITASAPSAIAHAGANIFFVLPFITAQTIFWKTSLTSQHNDMDISYYEL